MKNGFKHAIRIFIHLIVPEPEDDKADAFEEPAACVIVSGRICMLTSIQFYNDFAFRTHEIENEITKRMLATEFASVELSVTQTLPQFGFRLGGCVAQISLQSRAQDLFVGLSLHDASF